MEYDFFNHEKATLTVMVQANNPARIKELMNKAIPAGAEAFGIQFEQMLPEHRKPEVYRELFSYAKGRPSYVQITETGKMREKVTRNLATSLWSLRNAGQSSAMLWGTILTDSPTRWR